MAELSITRDATIAIGLALAIVVLARLASGQLRGRRLSRVGHGWARRPAGTAAADDPGPRRTWPTASTAERSRPRPRGLTCFAISPTRCSRRCRPISSGRSTQAGRHGGRHVAFRARRARSERARRPRGRRSDDYVAVQQASLVSGVFYLLLSRTSRTTDWSWLSCRLSRSLSPSRFASQGRSAPEKDLGAESAATSRAFLRTSSLAASLARAPASGSSARAGCDGSSGPRSRAARAAA